MTLFKIALKNIKKSIKDYSIFFLTLVVAVSILYMFNSLDAQSSMLELKGTKSTTIEILIEMLKYVSVFVSVVFGALIIFSNRFLVKRRKQEIGLYQVLGMQKRKVLSIIAFESIIVGLLSLVVGLVVGVFMSQIMSMITGYMFEVDLSVYHFIFSFSAFKLTIINFLIIFGIVVILNSFTLSRFKLIDLFNARRVNEQFKERSNLFSLVAFALSIALISYAYNKLYHGGIMMGMDSILMLVSGALGTLILFYSIASFFTALIKKVPNLYYKGLNSFVFKQINSKIKTSVLSTTIISLLLLLTIGILSLSIAIIDSFNAEAKGLNMTDLSIYTYNRSDTINDDIIGSDYFMDNVEDFVSYSLYFSDLKSASIFPEDAATRYKDEFDKLIVSQSTKNVLPLMRFSDYQKIAKLQGLNPVELDEDQYFILCNAAFTYKFVDDFYSSSPSLTVNGFTLNALSSKLNEMSLRNSAGKDITGVVVVHDKYVTDITKMESSIIANFKDEIDQVKSEEITNTLGNIDGRRYAVLTKYATDEAAISTKVVLMFVGLYLGLTFAITSATVLAIGQLTSASDNKERYLILRQLGVSNKQINKSLLIQIITIFALPLSVAIVHSYVGIYRFTSIIEKLVNIDILASVLKTSVFIIFIYGGYLTLTYLSAKKTIRSRI